MRLSYLLITVRDFKCYSSEFPVPPCCHWAIVCLEMYIYRTWWNVYIYWIDRKSWLRAKQILFNLLSAAELKSYWLFLWVDWKGLSMVNCVAKVGTSQDFSSVITVSQLYNTQPQRIPDTLVKSVAGRIYFGRFFFLSL